MTTEQEINAGAVKRLKKKIVQAESHNLYAKTKSDAEMVKAIKKMIEEEVKCCSNL